MSVTKKVPSSRLTVGYAEHHRLLKRLQAMQSQVRQLQQVADGYRAQLTNSLAHAGVSTVPPELVALLGNLLASVPAHEVADDLEQTLHLAVANGGAEYGLDADHTANLDTVFKLLRIFRRSERDAGRKLVAA